MRIRNTAGSHQYAGARNRWLGIFWGWLAKGLLLFTLKTHPVHSYCCYNKQLSPQGSYSCPAVIVWSTYGNRMLIPVVHSWSHAFKWLYFSETWFYPAGVSWNIYLHFSKILCVQVFVWTKMSPCHAFHYCQMMAPLLHGVRIWEITIPKWRCYAKPSLSKPVAISKLYFSKPWL